MENITVEYKPLRFLKYTRKINGAFPSTYEDLKPGQLIAIAALTNSRISETDFLKTMTGIPKYRIKKLDKYHRYQLMLLFEPFTSVTPYNAFVIRGIKISRVSLISPRSKLAGMSFAQFIFVESYFENYQTNKKPEDLHKFVASLYLPERQSFDENKIPAAALLVSKIKPDVLDAIVINYIQIKEWLSVVYSMVFQKETQHDENNELKKKPLKKPTNSGWIKIFENIVGDDLINHDRYSLIPVHTVLRWMSNKIRENKKRK